MQQIKLVVVESDPFRRDGLVNCLSGELDFRVIGAGANLIEALEVVSPPAQADVVIVNLDQMVKIRWWAILRLALPNARIVGMTDGNSNQVLGSALGLGVKALFLLDTEACELCEAVRNVTRGLLDYDPSLGERIRWILMQPMEEKLVHIGEMTIDLQDGELRHKEKLGSLTRREEQVLVLLSEGKSNRQIARELTVKESTVSFHMSNLLKKLGLSSRTEAIVVGLWFQRNGFLY